MSTHRYKLHDRRADDRPSHGKTTTCPECETGTLRFDARYSVPLATGGVAKIPSWICDHCQYGRPVRVADQPAPLRKSAKTLRAESNRQLMKARAVLHRAARALANSLRKRTR